MRCCCHEPTIHQAGGDGKLSFSRRIQNNPSKLVIKEWDGFYIGKRSSIYSYFYFHGGKFLDEKGRMGLITSNSWLDVTYGKYLQEFFLNHFKIVAIIESKIERWFEDADINTSITILEKCNNTDERKNNLTKFIQLKKPLGDLIPPTSDENERWKSVNALTSLIEDTKKYYEDENLRIFTKKQRELIEEVGFRWSRYIKAPRIFFDILDKATDILIPLEKIADIRWGSLKTGADKFFYLTEGDTEKEEIEKEFWMHKEGKAWIPNYVIKSPKESKKIVVAPSDLKYRVLLIHKDKEKLSNTKILKYINRGEDEGLHTRPTCASRQRWYDLGDAKPAPILWPGGFWTRFVVFYNKFRILADRRLFNVNPTFEDEKNIKILCAILNSSLTAFFSEIFEKTVFGQGLLLADVYAVNRIPILDQKKFSESKLSKLEEAFEELGNRSIGNIFEELGAKKPDEISLKKIKPDRRKIDKIIFESLGLTEEEQLEVYRALLDLVSSRIKKAKSVAKRTKKVKGIDVNALVEDIFEEVGKGRLMKFPDDYIEGLECREISVPEGEAEVGQDLYGFYVKINGKEIRCKSPYEAKYIQYAVLNGKTIVKIFKDEKLIRESVREYGSLVREVKKRINEYLESTIPDRKLRKRIKDDVWKRLTGQK